jgi:dTDP-D-glucose 4,6-dehydratase
MPTGPMNRVADNSLAKRLLGWEPRITFMTGLRNTIDWYFSTKDRKKVASELETLLTERQSTTREGARVASSDPASATVSA